ncbi:MAG: tRNA threonylcarbamoyladenosine dehydratase [Akkermansia sp.]|nr:tRNA threonylcarbamoyladenosine dehydratase [Akkermansia sp.]
MIDEERFGGIARLYGLQGAERLANARVAVVGIGGVGSWAAEALARSGVGTIILQDMDDLCITNTNRQIHAMQGTYGQMKVEVMSERLKLINPAVEVVQLLSFYTVSSPERLFDTKPDVVIDAIDSMRPKTHLIAECHRRGIRIVTCGGAGGRTNAAAISMADLARTCGDNMLSQLRKNLRQQYDFPLYDRCPEIGIPCVFSSERPVFPRCDGSVSTEREAGQKGGIGCASGFGSATHITGTFGFLMAGKALEIISAEPPQNS